MGNYGLCSLLWGNAGFKIINRKMYVFFRLLYQSLGGDASKTGSGRKVRNSHAFQIPQDPKP